MGRRCASPSFSFRLPNVYGKADGPYCGAGLRPASAIDPRLAVSVQRQAGGPHHNGCRSLGGGRKRSFGDRGIPKCNLGMRAELGNESRRSLPAVKMTLDRISWFPVLLPSAPSCGTRGPWFWAGYGVRQLLHPNVGQRCSHPVPLVTSCASAQEHLSPLAPIRYVDCLCSGTGLAPLLWGQLCSG
jgi:hypothetical protein